MTLEAPEELWWNTPVESPRVIGGAVRTGANYEETRTLLDSAEREALLHLTRQMVGLPCWRVWSSLGSSLHLELGSQVPYRYERLKDSFRGDWTLSAMASEWQLLQGDTGISSHRVSRTDRDPLRVLEGRQVASVDVLGSSPTLTMGFGNELVLTIFARKGWRGNAGLPYWEIDMPGEMLIEVGPGRSWRYGRAPWALDPGAAT